MSHKPETNPESVGSPTPRRRNPRTYLILFASCLVGVLSSSASARDTTQNHVIGEAMSTATAQSLTGVGFYFGTQSHPAVKRAIGTYTTKRTTRAFGKSDYESCQWGFLSAIKTLYERALNEGGNGVVNIVSVTTGRPVSSTTEFVCRAGNVVTKVYLRGDVVSF